MGEHSQPIEKHPERGYLINMFSKFYHVFPVATHMNDQQNAALTASWALTAARHEH